MTFVDKRRLFQTSILGSLLLVSAPAFAQDAEAEAQAQENADAEVVSLLEEESESLDDEDTIVVTGSRLRRNEFNSASPLQVIDGELSRDLGLVDAADLLGQTTVVQGQQITTGVSTSAGLVTSNGPGSATASLRGLDSSRTLVLINGRRLAPAGVRGTPSVPDLNMIPGTLIERVDVLLDGASSIYGSDAVAGVVNYQLRRDLEGLQFDVFATMPEFAGNAGHQEVYTASGGVSGDNGFISFAVEHSETDGFPESAFIGFYGPYSNGCRSSVAIGASGTIYDPDTCRNGTFGAGGVSSPVGFLAYEPGATVAGLPPNFSPVSITTDLIQPDNTEGIRLLNYPEELEANFSPDFERTTMYTFGELAPGWYGDATAYFEASYSERRTLNETSGQGAVELPASSVLNPFAGLGGPSTLFFRTNFTAETEVAQSRLIGGLRGDLPFMEEVGLSNWNYDVYGSYSRSSGQDRIQGVPYQPRLEQSINNSFIDPVTGELGCTPRGIPGDAQVVECRPLNFTDPGFLFTGRFPDDADTEYLFPNRLTNTVVTQSVYSAFVSGDLFNVPWGDTILVGFGAEYRKDFIETNTSLAGEFNGFSNDPGSNGERDLKEVFGEIEIPLVTDKPFVDLLNVNLAARYTDESNFGAEETYSVKGQYRPVDWLTFRGTYGTSYRAPDLGEQFGGRSEAFTNPGDPCRTPGPSVPFDDYDNDPSTPDTREYVPSLDTRDPNVIQNCLNGGGPFGLAPTNPFNLGIRGLGTANPSFFGAPTIVASGSNPNLEPETSEAFSLGATFEQPWVDDFDLRLAVTYFEIKVDDEIDQLTSNTIVNRCYNSIGLTDPTCAFITRTPRDPSDDTSGEITFVSALNQNLGEQVVEGIDYNLELGFNLEDVGVGVPVEYNFIGRATQSLKQEEELILATGTIIDRQDGEFGNPEWRLNLTNILRYKDFQLLFQSTYIDSMVENFLQQDDPVTGRMAGDVDIDQLTSAFGNCVRAEGAGPRTPTPDGFNCIQYDGLSDYWLHNLSFAYSKDTYVIRFGVNNVFDNAPPLTDNNDLANLGGIGYDIGGRTYFANFTKRF